MCSSGKVVGFADEFRSPDGTDEVRVEAFIGAPKNEISKFVA
jgi:hypothetical protein